MKNERNFLIIENLTQEEIDESFESLKKNIIRIFSDFRKKRNGNIKIEDLNYSKNKFIRINIDGVFILEGKYTKEYSFDEEKKFHTNSIGLIDVIFNNPITDMNTVFSLVVSDMKEFLKKSELTYKDALDINVIDDFVKFMNDYFQLFIDTYGLLEFNCLYIKKYGRIIQVIGENILEMEKEYKLSSSMNLANLKNKKWTYNIEEIIKMKFLEKISYEDLEKQYKEFIIEKM